MARKQRKLGVGVASAKQVGDDFVKAWKGAEAGQPPEDPVNCLHFADAVTLFRYLSPERFELLRHLRSSGPLSILMLASELQRDYENVHSDAKDLLHVGLIKEADDGLLIVPWDAIVSELSLVGKTKVIG